MPRRITVLLTLFCFTSLAFADVPTRGRRLNDKAQKALDLIGRSYKGGRLARETQARKRAAAADARATQSPLDVRVPVLLGRYSDSQNRFSRDAFQHRLFGDPNGSMTKYYSEVSYGNFNLTGEVFEWVTVPRTQAFYVSDNNNGLAGGGARFVRDLVQQADAGVDFSQFTYDEQGYAAAVVAVHTGGDAAASDTANIHSFKWDFNNASASYPGIMPQGEYVTDDPWPGHPGEFIKVNEFTVQPERHYPSLEQEDSLIEIGVFCHEFGHVLGLPDLYDGTPQGAADSAGVGNWCLMGGGAYGGDGRHPEKPTHMSAWSKQYVGWATPIPVTSDLLGQQIPQVEDAEGGRAIFKIPLTSGCGEYFLIENRQRVGFDQYLEGGGLLIWHVDECTQDNNEAARYKVALMQADGERDLETTRMHGGDKGDPFPGEGGANNPNRAFDAFSNPNSRDYAGHNTGIAVRNISDSSSVMTADLLASRAPKVLSISPARNGRHAPAASSILVNFSRALDPGSLHAASFVVSGSVSGPRAGSYTVAAAAVTFKPAAPFESGEVITVVLSDKIKSADDFSIAPHVSQFTVASQPAAATFDPGGNLNGDPPYLRAIFVADLNGDGLPDVAAGGRDSVSLWTGSLRPKSVRCSPGQQCGPRDAGRSFGKRVDIPVSGDVFCVQAADMDGDGDLDLVMGGGGAVAVALNNGDATFQPTASYPVPGSGIAFAVAGDLDGDGDADVAAANGNRLSVLRNSGNGTLGPPDSYEMIEYANSAVVADFDDDGDLDLAASSSAAGLGKAAIFINCSNAKFVPAAQHPLGNFTNTMLAADLDDDRDVDLLQIGCCGRHDGYSLHNNGDGTFTGPHWYGIWGNIGAAADLDGDGIVNVALIDTSYSPSFGRPPLLWVLSRGFYNLDHAPNAVAAADLDGDGDVDLATLDAATGSVHLLMNANSQPSRRLRRARFPRRPVRL